MKASTILLIFSLCYTVTLKSQASNWFIVVTPGYGIGGPGGSILSNVNKSGFNRYENSWFGSIKNPQVLHYPSLLLTLGKRIRRNGSIYLMIGQPTKGYVNGYNGLSKVLIDYSVLQCTAGYQFSFPKTHFKIDVGPSLFSLRYSQRLAYSSEGGNSTSIIRPGISVMTRIPLGGEKKIFGIELFFAFNIASGTTMKELPAPGGDLPSCNAGLVHAVAGISFAFRH